MKERGLERTLKALANRRRIAILKLLKKKGRASVGEIAEILNLSMRATSKHLSLLAHADVIENEQQGLLVFYRFTSPQHPMVKKLLSLV